MRSTDDGPRPAGSARAVNAGVGPHWRHFLANERSGVGGGRGACGTPRKGRGGLYVET